MHSARAAGRKTIMDAEAETLGEYQTLDGSVELSILNESFIHGSAVK
jgi:hypothetical protein